jgi:hypothetical protein
MFPAKTRQRYRTPRGRVGLNVGVGFQKLKGYERAARAAEVAIWCGLSDRKTDPGCNLHAPRGVTEGLSALDHLTNGLRLRMLDVPLSALRSPIREAFGLDAESNVQRMRVIVARAYAEAERVADAYAELLASESKARMVREAVGRALDLLGLNAEERARVRIGKSKGPLELGLGILDRWRFEYEAVTKGVADGAYDALHALMEIESRLAAHVKNVERQGRTAIVPREFFITRLAEAYAFSTQKEPEFHRSNKESHKNEPGEWQQFLTAAFSVVNFPTGTQGLDHALRAINSKPGQRSAIRALAQWEVGSHDDPADHLQSEGIKREWLCPRGHQ